VKRKGEIFSKLIESGKIVAKNENCPEITCGIVDTLGRKLCVKNGEECPLKRIDMDKNYTNYTNITFLNEGENDEGRILSFLAWIPKKRNGQRIMKTRKQSHLHVH
jgi:hypothetical protein